MSEWISVAERMPEIPADAPEYDRSVRCLAATATGYVLAVKWVQPVYTVRPLPPRWEYQDTGRLVGNDVTHWMPMPAPPKPTDPPTPPPAGKPRRRT